MGTIKTVMSSMGFTPARERQDNCGHCVHIVANYPDRMPPYDKPSFKCRKGGFYTSKAAVCKQHEAKRRS
jgi:hypothetical protein